jgi:ribonuclease HIII
MSDYSKMTDEDFDRILAEIINENPASHLLLVPYVYEALYEAYNNEVLERWELEQAAKEETK